MSQMLSDLVREHENIGAVLAALQTFTALHVKRTPEPRKVLGHFAVFFRDYLDRWHHGKEEGLLFPAMVDAGLPADVGPVGCMLREHDQGRSFLSGLVALCEGTGDLTPTEIGLVGELSVSYAELLTLHIAKENQMLYPMASRVLSPAQLAALDVRAAQVDGQWGQDGRDLEELGALLCSRFGGLAPRPQA